jgi:hypothetical protein
MTAWQMNNAGRVLFAVGTTAAIVGTTFLVFKCVPSGLRLEFGVAHSPVT